MPYSLPVKTRLFLGDLPGLFGPSQTEIQSFLDRGQRDAQRRGLLGQAIGSVALTTGVRAYTVPEDHVTTFALLVGKFQASLRLYDQSGTAWYLVVDTTGGLSCASDAPAGHVLLTSEAVSWVALSAPDGGVWYVYPSVTGILLADPSPPASGSGVASAFQLRDTFGVPWYLEVSDVGIVAADMRGIAHYTAPAVREAAVLRVEPEAIMHLDVRESSGVPSQYALMGKQLLVHPAPDDTYQLLHLYLSELHATAPRAAQYVPLLFAIAMGLQRSGRLAPARLVSELYREELAQLGTILAPASRDGSSQYAFPER